MTARIPASPALSFDRALLLALMLALLGGPFFRGLYFPASQLVAATACALLFAAGAWFLSVRGGEALVSSPLDAATLALALSYFLSMIFAVNRRAALQWALIHASCFMVYWLVSRLASRGDGLARVDALLHSVLAGATGVALLGLAAAGEVVEYPGAVGDGRIASTFQYPNTTAAFLTAALLLALSLWGWREDTIESGHPGRAWWWLAAYAFASWALFAVFFFTQSRGALLVLPAVLLLNLLTAPAGRRWSFCTRFAVVAIAFGASMSFLARGIAGGDAGPMAVGAALAMAAIAVTLPLQRRCARLLTTPRGRLAAAAAVVALGVPAAIFVPRLLPARVLLRIGQVGGAEYSAWSRVRFTQDAWRALREHPLLGVGGGGWEHLQYVYQSYGYSAKHIHNHFIQIPLETGIPGAVSFAAIWITLAVTGWTLVRRSEGRRRWLCAGALSAAAALGLHSTIDFNLALGAVLLTLWALLGASSAMSRQLANGRAARPASGPSQVRVLRVASIAGLLLAAVSVSLLTGYAAGQHGARLLKAGRTDRAHPHYLRARRFDPLNSLFAVDLGSTYERNGDLRAAEQSLRDAVRLSPYDHATHAALGRFLMRTGRAREGVAALRQAGALRQFSRALHEEISRAEINLGGRLLESNQPSEAVRHLRAVLEQRQRMMAARRSEPAFLRTLRPGIIPRSTQLPEFSPAIEYDAGRASLLLGQPREALASLERAAGDESLRAEVPAWLLVAARRARDREKTAAYRKAFSADQETVALAGAIERLVARSTAAR